MTAEKSSARRAGRDDGRLLVAVFTPAAAWIAAQQASYLLSGWACRTGHRWVLLLITASSFAAGALGASASWKRWRRYPAGDTDDPNLDPRRFLVAGGLLLAAVFLVAILSLAIPQWLHRPCD